MELIKTTTCSVTTSIYRHAGLEISDTYTNEKITNRRIKVVYPFANFSAEDIDKLSPLFVKPEFYDLLNTCNPFADHDKFLRQDCVIDVSMCSIEELEKLINEGSYCLTYWYAHLLFNREGVIIPTVLSVDYIGSYFANNTLDLEKALDVLKKHPWVLDKDSLKIQRIPYYNASETRYKCLQFKFLADAESFKEAYISNLLSKSGLVQILTGYDVSKKDYLGLRHLRKFDEDDG